MIPNSERFSLADLHAVANLHAQSIDKACSELLPVVIIDTDIYITKSYAKFSFDTDINVDPWVYEQNKADLRLYLEPSVSYVQDGSRMPKERRDLLDASHRKIIEDAALYVLELRGAYLEREAEAIRVIKGLFDAQWMV